MSRFANSEYADKVVEDENDSLDKTNDGDTTTIEDVQNQITKHNNNIDDKDIETGGSSSSTNNNKSSESLSSNKIKKRG